MTRTPDRLADGLLRLAVLSAAALCIPALQNQPLALDEHVSNFAAGAPSLRELWERSLGVMATPPLSHLAERASVGLVGPSETALRLPSLAFFVAAVLVLGLAGRRVFGPLAGGLAALILAWHPEVLDEVRIARCYGLELFLASMSVWMLARWISLPPNWGRGVAWAATCGLLLWTHYLAAPLVGVEAGIGLVAARCAPPPERHGRSLMMFGLAACVAVLAMPLAPPVLRLQEWGPYLNYRGDSVALADAAGLMWVAAMSGGIVLAGLLGRRQALAPAVDSSPPSRAWWTVAMGVMWIVPLAALAIAALVSNPTLANARYRIPLAPVASLFVAGLVTLLAGRRVAVAGALAAIVVASVTGTSRPWIAGRLGNGSDAAWKQAGRDLAARAEDPHVLLFAQSGLVEGFLVPAFPEDERFQTYVASRLGRFYTGTEKALALPLVWEGADELKAAYERRLADEGVSEVVVVGAVDTDLNRASIAEFEGLLRRRGFSPAGRQERPDTIVLRYVRRF